MTSPEETILTTRSVRKSFGGITALNNLSFDIRKEKITAVIGPNGAGKSTLINVLTGFLTPDEGEVFLNGQSIRGKKPHDMPRLGMARTFQTAQICGNMTVLENIMTGRHIKSTAGVLASAFKLPRVLKEEKEIRDQAMEYLALVGIAHISDQLAAGIPVGNQRLLEIARALATEPQVLLLDEPAAGLNTQETRTLGELIRALRDKAITVIIVEHDMELIMDISDDIIVIHFGEMIATGTPAEIQADPKVISVYLGSEA